MKSLLRNLTRFVETALQLYAPLPFQFTADMHTLNAYLRSYTQAEEKLLEGFVNRLVEKLQEKMKSLTVKEIQPVNANQSFDNVLRHYNSCTFKYPQLKLNLETDTLNNTSLLPEKEKPIYSQRSDKSDEGGINRNRHKFGNKQRTKLKDGKNSERDTSFDKENISINFNISKESNQDKGLKGVKSQLELCSVDLNGKKSVDLSLKERKQQSRNKVRYESNQSRGSNNASLKIKLKPKPTIDLAKIKQGIDITLGLFSSQQEQIMNLMDTLLLSEDIYTF